MNDMTPSNEPKTAMVQKTVTSLETLADVTLFHVYEVPTPVASVEEALAALGNNSERLLKVLNDGLKSAAQDAAQNAADGWKVKGEDGEYADFIGATISEDAGKRLNGAVLNMAKLFSGGAWDTAKADQKRVWKQSALDFIKANPAALAAIKGSDAAPAQ